MKKIVGAALLVFACAGMALAQAQTMAPAATPAKTPSVADAVKQVEVDWENALQAGDAAKLSTYLADDWVAIDSGNVETKQEYLESVKSGTDKLESFVMGPMSVKVVGSVAIVQGTDTEKSSHSGTDTSGKWAWMDVFVKVDGKWVAVRSQADLVK